MGEQPANITPKKKGPKRTNIDNDRAEICYVMYREKDWSAERVADALGCSRVAVVDRSKRHENGLETQP